MTQAKEPCDVIVVGAGAIGVSIAATLIEAGLRVVLVERGTIGAEGATGYSGGIIRQMDVDPVRSSLSVPAAGGRRSAVVRSAFDASMKRTGVIHIGSSAQCADLLAKVAGGVATACDPALATGLPLLSAPASETCAIVEYAGGISDVRGYVNSLAAYVRQRATLHDHLPVERYGSAGQDEVVVQAGNLVLKGKIVVDACGARGPAGRAAGLVHARTIPFTRFASDQVPPKPMIAHSVGTYVLPLSSTTMQVGGKIRSQASSLQDLDMHPGANAEDARNSLALLGFSMDNLHTLSTRVAYDAYTDDGLPVIGFTDPDEQIYLASGFCGVGYKMAPAVAELVTADILRRLSGRPLETAQRGLLAACAPMRHLLGRAA